MGRNRLHFLIKGELLATWLLAYSPLVAAQEPDPPPEAQAPEEAAQEETVDTEIKLSGLFYLTYETGGENVLMLDWDRRWFDDSQRPTDYRYQVVLQLKF
jgi:hypothetical protein